MRERVNGVTNVHDNSVSEKSGLLGYRLILLAIGLAFLRSFLTKLSLLTVFRIQTLRVTRIIRAKDKSGRVFCASR
jgi:hypothetical protein